MGGGQADQRIQRTSKGATIRNGPFGSVRVRSKPLAYVSIEETASSCAPAISTWKDWAQIVLACASCKVLISSRSAHHTDSWYSSKHHLMATSKDKHYWIQLRIALTGGLWDSHSPGKAPNAAPLSWSELLRKFKKHCSASSDFAELASQTQALSLLLAANASDQSLDGNDVGSNCPLELGRECLLD